MESPVAWSRDRAPPRVRAALAVNWSQESAAKVRSSDSADVFPPKFECLSAFLHELVPLIDRGNAGDCPALVVEDLVCSVRRYTQRRHAGHHGPAKIVKSPAGHA